MRVRFSPRRFYQNLGKGRARKRMVEFIAEHAVEIYRAARADRDLKDLVPPREVAGLQAQARRHAGLAWSISEEEFRSWIPEPLLVRVRALPHGVTWLDRQITWLRLLFLGEESGGP